ncbi:hypothetical protein E2C01_076905 [Portunus trituberculatus]|uniref:Uncharacterized protein n=1 Tax=Portunus trituberculatus TaxID=210409 RepID=A0A5B7IED6_PORTR|nr:hypothetical protein [Portunus trituberculatus]
MSVALRTFMPCHGRVSAAQPTRSALRRTLPTLLSHATRLILNSDEDIRSVFSMADKNDGNDTDNNNQQQ